jgi:hypothetical protein
MTTHPTQRPDSPAPVDNAARLLERDLRQDIWDFIAGAYAPTQGLVGCWPRAAVSRAQFEALARRVLSFQVARVPAYADYARRMRADLQDPWRAPPLPTDALKLRRVAAFDPAEDALRFRSSGTTAADRSLHPIRDLEMARAPLLTPLRLAMLPDLPDGARARMLILAPTHAQAPESSLYFMLDHARTHLGAPASAHGVGADGGLDLPAITQAIDSARAAAEPLFLLGPSFAFVHLLDAYAALPSRPDWRLPAGSRLFETGGFKGKSRTVPRAELHDALRATFGLPLPMIAAEYGMSELSSQLYEPSIRRHLLGLPPSLADRCLIPPPWCAVQVLDPDTLAPLPLGDEGLIAFLDLANWETAPALLTSDLGRLLPSPHPDDTPPGWHGLPDHSCGLSLSGRAPLAPPKGCSLAIDQLLDQ